MRAGYPGRMTAAVGKGSFSPGKLTGLQLFLDSSNSGSITKAYRNLVATGLGTISSNTITATADMTGKIQAGEKLRIGATDIYTVSSVSTVTITTVETLTATYAALSTLALDRVSQWSDLSGQSNHATQGTALTQPVYNPSQLNGNPVLAFDGASTMVLPANIYNICASGGSTVFVVSKQATASGVQEQIFNAGASSTSTRWALVYRAAASTVGYLSNNSGGNVITKAATTTNFNIITGRRSGTTQAISVNNGTETTDLNATDVSSPANANIGFGSTGANQFLTGQIAYIIVYSRSLSSIEIAQVNTWISQRTAITIS